MNTTYETKNKEQGMSDPNENKPGYKKTRMDGIPEGHIISDRVADTIDYSRDAMHGVSTPEIMLGHCREAMHRVSTL